MIKDFYKDLLLAILIVLLLLGVCVSVDYADDKITARNVTVKAPKGALVSNDSSIVELNDSASIIVGNHNDTVHIVKQKYPTISMWAKPSCGCRYKYTWHYREYVNYCPNCHHYGTLRKNPKGVPEREYTCSRCSSDFCGVCGKEKYSWSNVYLRKA